MPEPTRNVCVSLRPVRDARARRLKRRVLLLPALLLLVGGAGTIGLSALLPQQFPGPIHNTPAAEGAGALTEQEARRRAAALCARVAGPNAVAEKATTVVFVRPHDHASYANWQIDCRTDDGAYCVRLDAQTGELLVIAREPAEAPPSGDEGGGRPAGVSTALTAARAEAIARHYLRSLDVAPPPDARPEVRWKKKGPIYCGCSITFRWKAEEPIQPTPTGHERGAGEEPAATTQMVRVDIDAKDGSLNGLFRYVTGEPGTRGADG